MHGLWSVPLCEYDPSMWFETEYRGWPISDAFREEYMQEQLYGLLESCGLAHDPDTSTSTSTSMRRVGYVTARDSFQIEFRSADADAVVIELSVCLGTEAVHIDGAEFVAAYAADVTLVEIAQEDAGGDMGDA